MTDVTDNDENDDNESGSDERRKARRERWKKAIRASFLDHVPEASQQSARSGAEIDAEIAALEARVSALEANDAKQDQRLTALEAGEPVTPPVEPPIEPPIEPPVTGKRYPTLNDPMCGVPAGTQLQASGSITVSTANTTISGKDVNGSVYFTAPGGKLINCRVRGGAYQLVRSEQGASFEMHHCEIVGTGASGPGQHGFQGNGFLHHNRISNVENGLNLFGNGGIVEWNDIHGLAGPSTAHKDGIQADGNINGLKIRHNYLDNPAGETSACMLDNWAGAMNDVEVHDNFIGGGGYPAYIDGSFQGSGKMTNVVYHDNVMRKGGWQGYFYWKSAGNGCAHRNNVDYITGASADN